MLVTAWVAIAITHILLNRMKQEHGTIDDKHYSSFNGTGLTAWIIGTVVGILMLQLQYINPDLAGIGATWGPIVTCVVSSGLYALLWSRSSFKTALRKDYAGEAA